MSFVWYACFILFKGKQEETCSDCTISLKVSPDILRNGEFVDNTVKEESYPLNITCICR